MYLRRIRKPGYLNDNCWFCDGAAKMTRSHVLLHCKNPKLTAARKGGERGRLIVRVCFSLLSFLLYGGTPAPETCAHAPVEIGGTGLLTNFFVFALLWHISLRDDALFTARSK